LSHSRRSTTSAAGRVQRVFEQLARVETGILGCGKENGRWLLHGADEYGARPRAEALRHRAQRIERA
jgi:hypothetical protein